MKDSAKVFICLALIFICSSCFAIFSHEKVTSYNIDTKTIEEKEYESIGYLHSSGIRLELANGLIVERSMNQEIWIDEQGWKSYSDSPESFSPGKNVLVRDGNFLGRVAIVRAEQIPETRQYQTYFNVKDNHDYFYMGVLVHNWMDYSNPSAPPVSRPDSPTVTEPTGGGGGDDTQLQQAEATAAAEAATASVAETDAATQAAAASSAAKNVAGKTLELNETQLADRSDKVTPLSNSKKAAAAVKKDTAAQKQNAALAVWSKISNFCSVITGQSKKTNTETQKASVATQSGDPVLVTTGKYISSETDFECGDFILSRQYISSGKSKGSIGSFWQLSSDTRIIRGMSFVDRTLIQQMKDAVSQLYDLYAQCSALAGTFGSAADDARLYDRDYNEAVCTTYDSDLQSVYSQLLEYAAQVKAASDAAAAKSLIARTAATAARAAASSSSSAVANSSADTAESKAGEAEASAASAAASLAGAQLNQSDASSTMMTRSTAAWNEASWINENQKQLQAATQAALDQTTADIYEMYKSANQSLNETQGIADRSDALRSLNRYVDALDDSTKTGMTGNESLILIDESGSPVTYKYMGGGKWIPEDVSLARTDCITSNDGLGADSVAGFTLHTKSGIVKSYNPNGILIAIADRNGNAVEYNRIAGTYQLESVKANGRKFTFAYADGVIKKITGPENQSVSYTYRDGVLSGVTDVDGDTVGYQYDDGRLVKITKPDGNFVSLVYGYSGPDNARLTTSAINEEGADETFDYDVSNKATVHTNQSGVVTKYWYDDAHRTIREEHADGTVIQNNYNAVTGYLDSTVKNGDVTSYTYDDRGNLTSASYSDRSTESWTWNMFDEKTRYRDRDGIETIWAYDERGNCLSISVGGTQSFSGVYDEKGRLISCRRWNHAGEAYTYDDASCVIAKAVSSARGVISERWTYDKLGRITKFVDGADRVWTYVYDKKTVTERNPNGLERTYCYNNRKDLVRLVETDTMTGQTHETNFTYDKRHLPVSIKDGSGAEKIYTYRDDGLVAIVTTGKWRLAYTYDTAGRIAEVKRTMDGSDEAYSERYGYTRTASGEERTVSKGEGISELYRYDVWSRVISVTDSLQNISARIVSPEGRVAGEQSRFGGWFAYSYDSQGRPAGIGKEGAPSINVVYNSDGTIASKTDRTGKITTYSYDDLGWQTSESTENGTKHYAYDAVGRIVRMEYETDAQGTVGRSSVFTTWAYAPDGRTVVVNEGNAYATTWVLDAWGNALSKTDGTGNVVSWTYDAVGKLASAIDAYGKSTAYTWNAIGKLETVTNPDGTSERYDYTALGDVSRITDALGTKWEGSFDAAGRLAHEKCRPGIDKSYTYDALNRITSVSSGGEVVERYSYSDRGRRVLVSDGFSHDYVYEKDEFGQETAETNRLGDTERFAYDEEGSLIRKVKFSGKAIGVDYSGASTTVNYADGTSSKIVKDCAGLITRATGPSGTISYAYDEGGRLARQYDEKAAEETLYAYDAAGRRTLMKSGSREVHYQYGKNGEVLNVVDLGARLSVSFTYDAMGRETVRVYGNGVRQETKYDKIGRTIMIREISPARELLRAEGYVYDDSGRRACTVTEKGEVTVYEYDSQSRISAVDYPYSGELFAAFKTESEQASVPITEYQARYERIPADRIDDLRYVLDLMAPARSAILQNAQKVWRENYSYDRNGNRTTKQTPVGTLAYSYDAENKLVGKNGVVYSYDKDGNLLSEKGRVTNTTYEYTGSDRMRSATMLDSIAKKCTISYYAYDAFGRRTLAKDEGGDTMRTLYDGQTFDPVRSGPSFNDDSFTSNYAQGVLSDGNGERYRFIDGDAGSRYRYTSDGDIALVPKRYTGMQLPLIANGSAVAMNRSGSTLAGSLTRGGVSYLGDDALRSTKSSTNESGNLENLFEYDAFGLPVSGDFSTGLNAGYTGKPYDIATGLYDYGCRDYSPQLARFTTVDPVKDGNNWYAYVNNDPVDFVDPWGLSVSDSAIKQISPGAAVVNAARQKVLESVGYERGAKLDLNTGETTSTKGNNTDCSGLTRFATYQGTGVDIGEGSTRQTNNLTPTTKAQVGGVASMVGDSHVGIVSEVDTNGQASKIIESAEGKGVREISVNDPHTQSWKNATVQYYEVPSNK